MSYVNVGCYINGTRAKSKKAIKDAIASGDRVLFDCTAMHQEGQEFTPDTIPAGVTLSLVGPDPYTKRSFYGSVACNAAGKVTVK